MILTCNGILLAIKKWYHESFSLVSIAYYSGKIFHYMMSFKYNCLNICSTNCEL